MVISEATEMNMNHEIQQLIELVKNSTEPVQTVVDSYFSAISWSLLKQEYDSFSAAEKAFLIAKLSTERK